MTVVAGRLLGPMPTASARERWLVLVHFWTQLRSTPPDEPDCYNRARDGGLVALAGIIRQSDAVQTQCRLYRGSLGWVGAWLRARVLSHRTDTRLSRAPYVAGRDSMFYDLVISRRKQRLTYFRSMPVRYAYVRAST
eukprot:COSAG02_NODE_1356_length_13093_cov_351.171695_4_plen_137_part_00